MNPALDYITIKGFRSIRELEKVKLGPINVLIGPNGSGKSNFVEAFALLDALRSGKLGDYTAKHGGADCLLWFGSKMTSQVELEVSFGDRINGYHVELVPSVEDRFYTRRERTWFWDKKRHPEKPFLTELQGVDGEAGISEPAKGLSAHVQKWLDSYRIYHFHDTSDTAPIKKMVDIDDNRFFRADGSNLAAFLYLLKKRHIGEYALVLDLVRQVAPFLQDFRLAPLALNKSKLRLEWVHRNSDRHFDVSSLSDGTLRFICLTVLFMQPVSSRPAVIILDEPELGLHPSAIGLLAGMIKSASTRTQVVVATQSPLLLDYFGPEDVLVAEQVEGATTLKRLERADLNDWLEYDSLGQLWERNDLGGRP